MDNVIEPKKFYIGQVVKFTDYLGPKVGTIVATREDKPDTYLVIWRNPDEKWVKSENLEVETIETLKKYEERNQ